MAENRRRLSSNSTNIAIEPTNDSNHFAVPVKAHPGVTSSHTAPREPSFNDHPQKDEAMVVITSTPGQEVNIVEIDPDKLPDSHPDNGSKSHRKSIQDSVKPLYLTKDLPESMQGDDTYSCETSTIDDDLTVDEDEELGESGDEDEEEFESEYRHHINPSSSKGINSGVKD
ncbi:hypothetical protein Ddc_15469 [Ditylenchus destructor]|nr:hypothetical protein Ddc_15469 [Ditylenchus destructor]